MAASVNDKFRKLARRWVGQIGAGGVADDTTTTVPLSSATNLATDTGIDLVIDRVDSNGTTTASLEETIKGVVSGSNIVNSARGEEGTAQAHSAGAVVENLFTANAWNDLVDGILVEHAQDGTHSMTSPQITTAINDSNDNEAIKLTATASAVNELTVTNAATGNAPEISATGADTNIDLNLRGKGTGSVRFVDFFDGWVAADETWTYSAWDDTNGVSTASITVPTDATTKYQAGMRVKFSQTTDGVKYGIITKAEATTLTVFLNTDYDFDNETITSPFYSPMDIPFGFVKDPLKYQVETTITAGSQATPTQNQWYNIESNSIDIPVGSWHTGYETVLYVDDTSATNVSAEITLSTANNSESAETTWTTQTALAGASGTLLQVTPVSRNYTLTLATKDTYYLNARTTFSGIAVINVGYQVAGGKIRAICAYL